MAFNPCLTPMMVLSISPSMQQIYKMVYVNKLKCPSHDSTAEYVVRSPPIFLKAVNVLYGARAIGPHAYKPDT